MKYKSTRGQEHGISFLDVLLNGLASDGGLYVPESIPQPDATTWTRWLDLDYADLSFEILRLYISEWEIPSEDLRRIVRESYASFRNPQVTPVTAPIGPERVRVLELFHGPTFAFKDVALQLLGRLFEFALVKRSRRLTVIGATSGDTGGAALAGVAGRPGVNCVILYPLGRTSEIQELQMTQFNASVGTYACAVEGSTFDDCQSIVKQLLADEDLNQTLNLGAVNSINWARILAQIVYYVYACARLVSEDVKTTAVFAVPTGNFGDVLAGYYARRMRLPIEKLVVASNKNDVLPRFFATGEYRVAEVVQATMSPSMDIAVSSNFERYLYYLLEEDADKVSEKFEQLKRVKHFTVTREELKKTQIDFVAYAVNEAETLNTIQQVFTCTRVKPSPRKTLAEALKPESPKDYLLCPHSAVGFKAALNFKRDFPQSKAVVVSLATAHIGKFVDSIVATCDVQATPEFFKALMIATPAELAKLRTQPGKRVVLKKDVKTIAEFLMEKFGSNSKRRRRLAVGGVVAMMAGMTAIFLLKRRVY